MPISFQSIYPLSLSIFIALVAFSCRQQNNVSPNSTDQTRVTTSPQHTQSVEVVHPETRTFEANILITGTAEANQKITLYAMESGYVSRITKNIGDHVKKGETIATLQNPEVSQLLAQKNIQLAAKKTIYDRLASVKDKTPSLTTLETVDNAQANFQMLQAEVSALKQRQSFLTIKAPFSGQITKRLVDHGALVQQGLSQSNPQGIVEIQQTNTIRVTVPFPEADIAGVTKGMPVTVTFPELSGDIFNATISRLSGALDLASKTMMAEIDIDNSKELIKPGMYAKVSLDLKSRANVLSLPLTAQVIHQNDFFVLIVKNRKVKRIALRKGLTNTDYFEVLNPEITAETQVIIQGKSLVNIGQTVKPVLKNTSNEH